MVAQGSDLLETAPGTFFQFDDGSGPETIPFDGLPLEQFDFGGTVGVQDTGTADTIVERLQVADSGGAPGTDTFQIQLVALRLVSSDGSNLFITLQSDRDPGAGDPAPGPASTGSMDVTFTTSTEGTFDSTLDVWFDVRRGAPDAPILASDVKTLTSTGVAWGRTAPAGAVTLPGVNFQLDGGTTGQDFWPAALTEASPEADHVVEAARVPQFCVGAGWDLFETRSPTVFRPGLSEPEIPLEGVPLGSFDFEGTLGPRATGSTDTIVRRTQGALGVEPGDDATIPIELVELRLRSVEPVDLGAGPDFHFVTPQSNRGPGDPPPGPPSLGTMTFTFDSAENGTFTSSLDVWFDVRKGSLDGPIVHSGVEPLPLRPPDPVAWDRTPPARAVAIDGVNVLLVGGTTEWDFWPHGPDPDGSFPEDALLASHRVRSALFSVLEIPALGTLGLLALGLVLAGVGLWAARHGAPA
ncbi:MAG TPA: hypothetical protein VLF66_13395 [Thermoanaerobaculia bacterium]|nr:hypothetical protein [Thermoanaerobaculia bacterium]